MDLFVFGLSLCFFWIRANALDRVRDHFDWDFEFYPERCEVLPSPMAMMFHPRYQHLWTKAQWVKWVKAQGVAK